MFGRALHAVVWQQGTLVAPQHLQHQDAAHDARTHARLYAAMPHSTGIVHIELDALALALGRVSLLAGLVVMPSGEVVEWQSEALAPFLTRALPKKHDAGPGGLHLHLVLPKRDQHGPNIAQPNTTQEQSRSCRHIAQSISLPERTCGQTPAVDVMLAAPNVQLAFANELRDGDDHLHVMTVHPQPNGSARIDSHFVPQSLRLTVSPTLCAALERLHLAARTAAQHAGGNLFVGAPAQAVVRHRGLVQLCHALQDLLGDPATGPAQAYHLLRAALPWVSLTPPEVTSNDGPLLPYNHTQPGLALWPLIDAMHGEVSQGPSAMRCYEVVQMGKSGLFLASLTPYAGAPHNTWFLQVRVSAGTAHPLDEQTRAQCIASWQRLAKVAAPSQMPKLIRSALRGVSLRHVEQVPQGMACPSDTVVFALQTQDPGWTHIEKEQELALLPPPGPGHSGATLTVVCIAEGQA